MLIAIWYWTVHTLGIDYGVTYGHWIWYNFWSGVAGSFLVGITVWLTVNYIHHTCHAKPLCLRWGKYEAAKGIFKLCYKHHPNLDNKRPSLETIQRLHKEIG